MSGYQVNLKDILNKFNDFEHILGPAELQILKDADILLKGTIPTDPAGRMAYLARNSQVQSSINNLLSRLDYIINQEELEKNIYWGRLLYDEEYEGKDKWVIAVSQDLRLVDMTRVLNTLNVVKSHANNLYWTLKTLMGRV